MSIKYTCDCDLDVKCDEALPTEPAPEATTAGSVATITDGGNGGAVGGMVYFDVTNNTSGNLILTSFDMNITANTLVDVYTLSGTSVGNTANAGLWTLAGQMDATTGAVSGPFPGDGTLTPAVGSITIAPGVNGIALHTLAAANNYTNGNGANQSFGDAFIQLDLGSASKRWRNIYTTDLHLANERGNWTVIEEEDCLTLRNNKTNKVYKIVMEEIE